MRTLIAILKDSYREAVSGWVLQGMMILVALFLLFVLSVSFRLMQVDEVLNGRFNIFNTLVGGNPQFGSPKIRVENATAANKDAPWASAHQFDVVITCPTLADFEKAKKSPLPVKREQMERVLGQTFTGVTLVEKEAPGEAKPGDDAGKVAVVRYQVNVTGTKVAESREWPHMLVVLFAFDVTSLFSPRDVAYFAENYLVSGVGGWIFSLLAVIITAAFVPNMLSKGALDLLIAKPTGRVWLLVCKYLGGLTFMLLITAFAVVGVYLTIGFRVGVWAPHFLAAIPLLTFQFAILYAVSTLIGVLTRNTLVAILGTIAVWFMLFAVGSLEATVHEREREGKQLDEMLESGKLDLTDENGRQLTPDEIRARIDPNRPILGVIPAATFPFWKAANIPLPRMKQIDNRMGRLIAEGTLTERQMKSYGWSDPPRHSWAEVIGVSLVFIVLMLGLASLRFVTRDG